MHLNDFETWNDWLWFFVRWNCSMDETIIISIQQTKFFLKLKVPSHTFTVPDHGGRIHSLTWWALHDDPAFVVAEVSFTSTKFLKTSDTSPITATFYARCSGTNGGHNAPRDPATQEARRRTRWGWQTSPPRGPGAQGLSQNRRGVAGATLLQQELHIPPKQ